MKKTKAVVVLICTTMLCACGKGNPKPETIVSGQETETTSDTGDTDDTDYTEDTDNTADAADTSDLAETEDGQYKNTVTVSSIQELVEEIGSDTHIILKAGEYNFTELAQYEIGNSYVHTTPSVDNREYDIHGVNNMSIEAEEGAAVEIVTENPYTRTLSFSNCSRITLKGFSCGHKTNPGSCKGSVIYAKSTRNLTIEECMLYGCGTYGLETDECDKINVIGTEIYECSWGIVGMYETNHVTFKDCSFHDNTGNSLFAMDDCYNISFEDTEIRDNSNSSSDYIINTSSDNEICFSNCIFEGNANEPNPEALSKIATFENCDIQTMAEHIGYVGYFTTDDKDTKILHIDIAEAIKVTEDDTELMDIYGLTAEDMESSYAYTDGDKKYVYVYASEDSDYVEYLIDKEGTKFYTLWWDEATQTYAPNEVDYNDFENLLAHPGQTEMLVSYTVDTSVPSAPSIVSISALEIQK